MARVDRGDIWRYAFPKPDRRRPVLVLTRGELLSHMNTVTVAPITSTIRGTASEVVIAGESGLKRPSAINLDHVSTVPRAGLRTYVGSVSPAVMNRVRDALLFALGWSGPPEPNCK